MNKRKNNNSPLKIAVLGHWYYPEALGLRHLAFKVKSVDDTVKELNAKGIATEPVRLDDYTGKKMTFFHDPDNLPLEIHE
mgnify:CR=1 FL=1